MPPCVDVYVRLEQVDQGVLADFLASFLGSWRMPEAWMWADAYDAATDTLGPVGSGLTAYSRRTTGEHCYVMIAFPHDGGVVLGVSIDQYPDEVAADCAAGRYLDEIMRTTRADEGFARVEEPPPLSTQEWREVMERTTTLHIARR